MTTTDLLAALSREYPSGVSFEPMAVRLLRQKFSFEDWQIEELKTAMFQVENGVWLSNEMVLDDKLLFTLKKQAAGWLKKYGCFSVKRLFDDFRTALILIKTPESFSALLKHLEFQISEWESVGHFCTSPSRRLNDALITIAETVSRLLEEAGGTLAFQEIEQKISHLTVNELECLRVNFLPEIHKAELGGVLCWRTFETITLPEDFSEKLRTIVDTLNLLKEKISIQKLEFALNLFYCIKFREEYSLMDNDAFLSICAKHYKGESFVFQNTKKNRILINDSSTITTRVRSPNTRFRDLGVPCDAQLVFIKDINITCTVLNDINQVEYDGKVWSISSLAMHLLDASTANGFCFFSYEEEILWDRRLRLEQAGTQSKISEPEETHSVENKKTEDEIIGLSGQVISASTWRAFKRDGTSPRVAVWAERAENGESVEKIAQESGYAVPTMKNMISNYHIYFKVCKLNGIAPGGDADV